MKTGFDWPCGFGDDLSNVGWTDASQTTEHVLILSSPSEANGSG